MPRHDAAKVLEPSNICAMAVRPRQIEVRGEAAFPAPVGPSREIVAGFAAFRASLIGSILPGGPIMTFPLVVAIHEAGAGTPQMVALLTAWATYAAHRILAFELPMLGVRFVMLRVGVSLALPPLAGALASVMQQQVLS